nr:uncharacterized protein LOC128681202 [Plodia interpunctella]
MAPKKENRLKQLKAKKDMLYSRMQDIFDHSLEISDNEVIRALFLCEVDSIDTLREEYGSVVDNIHDLELELDSEFVVNYDSLKSFDSLFYRVKRTARSLEPPPPAMPAPNFKHEVSYLARDRPKLPSIQIPEFNGDIKNWPLFFASFENTIHNNHSLSDHEKLHYLINKLTGKAKSVCAGITPYAENYSLILSTLKAKYEDKRLVATSYLEQIFNLKNVSVCNEQNLENFLDTFASSVRAIKNLRLTDLTDFLFLFIALKKLDPETVRLFELDNRDCNIPTFDRLESFVREHIKILQRTSSKTELKKYSRVDTNTSAKPTSKVTHTYVNTTSDSSQSCSLCKSKQHILYRCSDFLKLTPYDRYKFARTNNLCINCLCDKHRVSNCTSKSKCRKCQNSHHSTLHFDNNNSSSNVATSSTTLDDNSISESAPAAQAPPRASQPLRPPAADRAGSVTTTDRPSDVTLCSLSIARSPTTVLLATARVVVRDSRGTEHSVRALLDSASQSNFVTRSCCERLGLISNRPGVSVVKGIGGSTKAIQGSVKFRFYSRFDSNIHFDIESLVVDKVTERLPTVSVDTSMLSNFNCLSLADNTYATPGNIDVLIGASIFPHLLLSNKVQGHPSYTSPYALETVLGFVVVGSAPARVDDYTSVSYCCTADPLESAVRKFWEIEEVNVPPILSPDDKVCEEIYSRTTTRDSNGRYIVALPFKGEVYSLGDSRQMAEKRFLCLERKLQASSSMKQAYDAVVREYLDKGYISLAPPDTQESQHAPSYTIPHHGVVRQDKLTTNLRVVLDGSARTSTSVSLNDILYSGQNLQGNLFDIIVNFRLFAVALSADIRQMFLRIGVRECDRRFQRFLYRFSPQEPLKTYEFNCVCFGLKSSPFHALRTVKQLASDEGDAYPKARQAVENGLYMDDLVYCLDSEADAIETASQVIALMKAGQFDLVKWTSNSKRVLDSIPPSHRLSQVKEFDDNDPHKVLGLCWSPDTDLFSLKICSTSPTCTKRAILSCVARIWDITGFVAPVVLYAKLLIKELWLCNCDWDDTPPAHIAKLWARFREELPLLCQLKIPRHIGVSNSSIVTVVGFADASERGYGGVVYFHVANGNSNSISLISAKSKIAPRKVVSLARLELCALLVLSQLIGAVIKACCNRVNLDKVIAFSDSTVALCWAHSSPHRWDTFVANRVAKIQSFVDTQNLFHIAGTDNPADCLSRGLTPAQILDHPLWFHGPQWLSGSNQEWPVAPFNPATVSEPPEERKSALVFVSSTTHESTILSLAGRVSSWSKLLRCVVYICRFMKILPPREHISASDLDKAEILVLRELQRFHFSSELKNINSNKFCSRAFRRLKPFMQDGLIRVGGRLSRSELDFDHKHPIVLPRKDHIVDLIIDYHHKVNAHAGPDLLMSILRQRYWILSARSTIRARIYKCIPCFRLRPKNITPEMADHRSCRVVQSTKPFVHTGTDYAGPFRVTLTRGRGVRSTKAYICLFICMTTRAIHIELVGDLSTASFLAAFKRFLSRRGPVRHMYSDNGTNYVGAKRSISELQGFLSSKHFNTEYGRILAENRIDWSFNAPAASHFGGDWESNIKSLKTHLFRVVGDQILSFEELSTVLAQVEAVMNSRPLCRTLSNDPSEPLALTPAHFLNLTPLKFLPVLDVDENSKLHLLSRYDLLDRLVQSFWKRWKNDYLHTLQSRQKWTTATKPVTVGTVVILLTENVPPLHWPMGVVEEIFPGSNGVVRVVRVRTTTGTYLRPVVRLCPLPNQ